MNNNIVPGFDSEIDDEVVKLSIERIKNMDDGLMISVAGVIDAKNVGFVQEKVEKVFQSGFRRIVFEMSELNYLSEVGDLIVPYIAWLAQQSNGKCVIQQIQPHIYRWLELIGYSSYLSFTKRIDESISLLNEQQ
jgi:anti-sigma B factor antagonist